MRAAHTYRAERRDVMRAARLLNTWGSRPLRVWMSGHRDKHMPDGTIAVKHPWHVLVRTMPAILSPRKTAA